VGDSLITRTGADGGAGGRGEAKRIEANPELPLATILS